MFSDVTSKTLLNKTPMPVVVESDRGCETIHSLAEFLALVLNCRAYPWDQFYRGRSIMQSRTMNVHTLTLWNITRNEHIDISLEWPGIQDHSTVKTFVRECAEAPNYIKRRFAMRMGVTPL